MSYYSLIPVLKSTLRDGLIHEYRCDETSGTIMFDSVGSSNFNLLNGVLINQIGKVNKCMLFDGLNDRANNNTTLGISNYPFAYCLWYYANNVTTTNKSIIQASNTSNTYKGISILVNNQQLIFRKGNGNSGNTLSNLVDYTTGNVLSVGWNHIILNCISEDVYECYINGIFTPVSYLNGTATSVDFSSQYQMMYSLGQGSLAGRLDEVKFYNRTLTSSEALDIFNIENSGNYII